MSLRRRTLLIVIVLMLAAWLLVNVVERLIIYPNFVALEHEQARRNAERVMEVMNRELALLVPLSEDWAYWDDSYDFIQNSDEQFIQANLSPASQSKLKINLLSFVDSHGRNSWSRCQRSESLAPCALDEYSSVQLQLTHPLLSRDDTPTPRGGLINTSRGPMLAASAPILKSDQTGPRRGTLIMARFLDTQAISAIAKQTSLKISLRLTRANATNATAPDSVTPFIRHSAFVYQTLSDSIHASSVLAGIDGKPLLELGIDTPRDVSARGRDALQLSMLCVALAGMVLTLTLLWQLDKGIVEPLKQLTQLVRKIDVDGGHQAKLDLHRVDEIGMLGDEFDRMLERLADTRNRLLKASYQSGAKEMAGGVVTNLRQTLQPLRHQIGQPIALLDRAHLASMQMLMRELATHHISEHRHGEILSILQDQATEHADILAEARAELRGVRNKIDQMHAIIMEYSRFISSPNAIGSVPVGELIDHALRNTPAIVNRLLDVHVDAYIYRLRPVEAAREVLQQIINVLITHAAENPAPTLQSPRTLNISAGTEIIRNRPMLHFRFDDNRQIIDPQWLADLFEPNLGDDEHGLSLSWAENAVSSMGGRLTAETKENVDGLVIHLLLPQTAALDH